MIKQFILDGFDAKKEYENITERIRKDFENGKGVVLGMSGGKDSSFVAKAFCDALSADKVTGVIMPNGEMKDLELAEKICRYLNIKYFILDISEVYKKEIEMLQSVHLITTAAKVNILPRIRMTTLYALAQSLSLRVAGTGNLSERTIGYCTKWGDMASDYNPLAQYTCSEVFEIGKTVLPDWIIDKNPDDGLWGRTDEDNFGFSYFELDKYIRTGLEGENIELIKRKIEQGKHKINSIPNITPLCRL